MPVSTFRTLDLPGGGLVPFTSKPGERIRILHGRIWLTEEGVARDVFLTSGEEVSLGSRGLAVIEALGPARIQVVEDVQPSVLLRAAAMLGARVGALLRRLAAPRAARAVRGSA